MYISEFVCGIGATLIAEIVASVIWAIYVAKKKKK